MSDATELTARQAALRLNVSLAYVYHLLWAGKLPARRLDGRWRIPEDAVEVRLRAKETASGTASR